ncbi:hypothetical protein O9G_003765 [Rozella allomycis CSF55]|uniref:Uncharacterized protein n=1 Tax=Rozella allomycis (strain CSF55) TaxID=988480 RepID=A0A075AV56_ROZAC|nr:hypothetical protein O9G_003765 [Rozella allomycis CSF55]|eukprot:EPZ34045.1 hypothetical protein O9G_003765 [Rozella allomycis CSF55]
MLCEITQGLGHRFEQYNAEWIRQYFRVQGYGDIDLIVNRREADLMHEVNEKGSEFEIDIMCFEPFLICEATSYLKEDEVEKVDKFVKIGQVMRKRYMKKPEMFFFALAVEPRIKEEVKMICAKNNIKLVTQW